VEIGRYEMRTQNPTTELTSPKADTANTQPRRLQIALVLLLAALAIVLIKDRDFWFGSDEAIVSDAAGSGIVSRTGSAPVAAKAIQPSAAPATVAKNHVAAKTSAKVVSKPSGKDAASQASANPVSATPASATPASADPASSNPASPAVVTARAILPPLDVEVVAGDNHRTVHPGSNVAKVEIPSDSNRVSAVPTSVASLTTNAAQRERLSAGMVPELRQSVDVAYPLLGQHMKVQGSVVLQAVVGTDGTIEDLRVLSGPAILTAAAQQAVRQWRFKPYLQNGQAVETKATITVNFSIRISDNPANAS
jgi:TonB family protein